MSVLVLSGCQSQETLQTNPIPHDESFGYFQPGTSADGGSIPNTPQSNETPVRRGRVSGYSIDVLLFNGSGTWQPEVSTLKKIMNYYGFTYREVSSTQLNAMSVEDLASFGMIIWPGGSGTLQMNSIPYSTRARIRTAVQQRGVSYLGFCAGAFAAVAPAPQPGSDVSYGLALVNRPTLGYYYLEYQLNPDIAITKAEFANGTQRDVVWYGGPVTPEIPGGVVARYPTGEPMITETWAGNGYVLMVGTHMAVPQSTKDEFGLWDSDGSDSDLVVDFIRAGLSQAGMI